MWCPSTARTILRTHHQQQQQQQSSDTVLSLTQGIEEVESIEQTKNTIDDEFVIEGEIYKISDIRDGIAPVLYRDTSSGKYDGEFCCIMIYNDRCVFHVVFVDKYTSKLRLATYLMLDMPIFCTYNTLALSFMATMSVV